jgi:SOS-response transcriptional repressor LexA
MSELPKKQRRVLDFIQKRLQTDGLPPTMREIARHFGFRSPGTVAD